MQDGQARSDEAKRDYYADRKAQAGRCERCPKRGLPDDVSLCPRCTKRTRKRSRLRMRDIRRARRAEGKCAECGLVKSEAYRCAGCNVKTDRIPKAMRTPTEMAGDQWRKDGDGWARFRGRGRRGAPGAAANDDQDLASAIDALEKGRAAMRYARSPEVLALPRIQRRGALSEATALVALAARFCDDIVDRNTDDTV